MIFISARGPFIQLGDPGPFALSPQVFGHNEYRFIRAHNGNTDCIRTNFAFCLFTVYDYCDEYLTREGLDGTEVGKLTEI